MGTNYTSHKLIMQVLNCLRYFIELLKHCTVVKSIRSVFIVKDMVVLWLYTGGGAPTYGQQQLMAVKETNNKKKRLSLRDTLRGRQVGREGGREGGGREGGRGEGGRERGRREGRSE